MNWVQLRSVLSYPRRHNHAPHDGRLQRQRRLLQVVPEKAVMRTIVADADVKDRVEASCPFQIP
jgi:hypothetical protein